jgi:glutathione S-transferase
VPRPILFTIGISHFCEKARWALDRARVGYEEHAYPPVMHYAATYPRFRQRSTPILATPHGVVRDSTSIVRHADQFLAPPDRLWPESTDETAEVDRLVALFDSKLGPHSRRIAYFYLLSDLPEFTRISLARSTLTGRVAFRLARPALVQLIRRGLHVDEAGLRRSEERLAGVFDEVDALLAKRGSYLVGSRMSAADLTFAALAAPILVPPAYGWPLPKVDETPAPFRALVARYRERRAGRWALELYARERGRVVGRS